MNKQSALNVIKQLLPEDRFLVLTKRMSGPKWTMYDKERNPIALIKLSLIDSMRKDNLLRKVIDKKTRENRLVLSRRGILQLHGKSSIKKGYKAIR